MLKHLENNPKLHEAVMSIAALLKQNDIKPETVYLVMYLLDSMEKYRTFAKWVLKYMPEGNPLNIDSEEIERVVNKVALERELPDITEPIIRPQGRDKIIYDLQFNPNSEEMLALIDDLMENHGVSLFTGDFAAVVLKTEEQQQAFRKWLSVNLRKSPKDEDIRRIVLQSICCKKMPPRRRHRKVFLHENMSIYHRRLWELFHTRRQERDMNKFKRFFETGRW